jgi:hypothetical protein
MWLDNFPWIKKQLDSWTGSLSNEPGGWSSKKLTAFGAFIVSAILSLAWGVWAFLHGNWDILLGVLAIWIGIVYAALKINSQEKEKGIANQKEDKPDGTN